MSREFWSDYERAQIERLAPTMGYTDVSRRMGRTPDEVRHYASRNGITFGGRSMRAEPQVKSAWTDERVAKLRQMHADGLSASESAKRLGGGVTRNAIVGKWFRLGLKHDTAQVVLNRHRGDQRARVTRTKTGTDPNGKPLAPAKPRAIPKAAAPAPDVRKITVTAGRVIPLGPAVPLPLEPAHTAEVIPLVRLGDHTCRWPIGNPSDDAFGFCGAHTDGTYCEDHARLAYNPMSASSRRRSDSQALYLARRAR